MLCKLSISCATPRGAHDSFRLHLPPNRTLRPTPVIPRHGLPTSRLVPVDSVSPVAIYLLYRPSSALVHASLSPEPRGSRPAKWPSSNRLRWSGWNTLRGGYGRGRAPPPPSSLLKPSNRCAGLAMTLESELPCSCGSSWPFAIVVRNRVPFSVEPLVRRLFPRQISARNSSSLSTMPSTTRSRSSSPTAATPRSDWAASMRWTRSSTSTE